jgi:hypothetical protein
VTGFVQPFSCGIGGDLFAIVQEPPPSSRIHGLNASGWAPRGLALKALRDRGFTGTRISSTSAHAVTIPGCVAGWESLRKRFGRMSLAQVLALALSGCVFRCSMCVCVCVCVFLWLSDTHAAVQLLMLLSSCLLQLSPWHVMVSRWAP